jgi:hypothetical protein
MRQLFPELRHSTNIEYVKPSAKSLRRFPGSDLARIPLEKTMWVHTLLDCRIRGNVKEVAVALLSSPPPLLKRAFRSSRQDITARDRWHEIEIERLQCQSWPECRLALMRELIGHPPVDFRRPSRRPCLSVVAGGSGDTQDNSSSRSVTKQRFVRRIPASAIAIRRGFLGRARSDAAARGGSSSSQVPSPQSSIPVILFPDPEAWEGVESTVSKTPSESRTPPPLASSQR